MMGAKGEVISAAEALARAAEILKNPGMTFGERSAREIIAGLVAGIQTSTCFEKALIAGDEVFVLRQQDKAAPFAIKAWAALAAEQGAPKAKCDGATDIAHLWETDPLPTAKWPD